MLRRSDARRSNNNERKFFLSPLLRMKEFSSAPIRFFTFIRNFKDIKFFSMPPDVELSGRFLTFTSVTGILRNRLFQPETFPSLGEANFSLLFELPYYSQTLQAILRNQSASKWFINQVRGSVTEKKECNKNWDLARMGLSPCEFLRLKLFFVREVGVKVTWYLSLLILVDYIDLCKKTRSLGVGEI